MCPDYRSVSPSIKLLEWLTELTSAELGLPSGKKWGSLPKKAAGKPGLNGAASSSFFNCSVVKVILSDYLVSVSSSSEIRYPD